MAKIHYQRQPSEFTCGQTCVAMLTGIRVDDVISEIHGHTTSVADLGGYLRKSGWHAAWSLTRVNKHVRWPEFAILRAMWPKTGRIGHWMLWADGRIYDPWSDPTAYQLGGGRITSYIHIERS